MDKKPAVTGHKGNLSGWRKSRVPSVNRYDCQKNGGMNVLPTVLSCRFMDEDVVGWIN